MTGFILRFWRSIFQQQKKEIFWVIGGMFIGVFMLLFVLDSAFTTEWNQRELEFYTNRVTLTFPDTEGVEEVLALLGDTEGVSETILSYELEAGSFSTAVIASCSDLSWLEEISRFSGTIPDGLSDGEAIISGMFAEMNMGKSVVQVGTAVELGDEFFSCVADVNGMEYDLLVSEDAFFRLFSSEGQGALELTYVYDAGFGSGQRQALLERIAAIREPAAVEEERTQPLELSSYLEILGYEKITILIVMLNYLLLLAYMFRNRITPYCVLKLHGVSGLSVAGLLFLDYLVIYLSAFGIAGLLYYGYRTARGMVFYHTGEVYLYTFFSLFILNALVYLLIGGKLLVRRPIELFRQNRGAA